jgi:hypothetical protein
MPPAEDQTERFAAMLSAVQQAFDAIVVWAPGANEAEINIYEKMTEGLSELLEYPWAKANQTRN